jgi:hypothetical protein
MLLHATKFAIVPTLEGFQNPLVGVIDCCAPTYLLQRDLKLSRPRDRERRDSSSALSVPTIAVVDHEVIRD